MTSTVVSSIQSKESGHYAMWPWGLPFSMVRTTAATVVWENRSLPFEGGEQALLDEFAWNVPIDKTKITPDTPTKMFYAECYGGDGIHYNGGGARCAWSGNWLVKGIGINLLSGYSDEDAASHRKNGRGSACEMLVEAIWGEVLNYALPYGAARMAAVVRTGETLADPLHPTGGIGIRQFVWRPAHFMRAHTFRIRPENRGLIPSDTARVKEAIARLPQLLPTPLGLTGANLAELEPLARLKVGLEEMVRRFAEQMAAAKAKRLSHGTLTPSNVCLDGRWNDLNSVSALPSYGYRRNMQPFWLDQRSLNRTIDLLCFYIRKYFPAVCGQVAEAMPTADWLGGLYFRYYNNALAQRFVAICGYPQIVADKVYAKPDGKNAMRILSEQLIMFARSGHSPRRPFDDEMQENTVSGDYNLPEILRRMTGRGAKRSPETVLNDLIVDSEVRHTFVERYRAVEQMMFLEAASQGVSESAFARLVAINCNKAGRNIPFLFRNVIFHQCRLLTERNQDIGEMRRHIASVIQPVIDEARMVYQEPRDYKSLLWCSGSMTCTYDARTNLLLADIEGNEFALSCLPEQHASATPVDITTLVCTMRNYWGKAYEEIMQ